MKTSVIIPAYNEERTICRIITELLGLSLRPEIVVVDDGSTDATPELVQGFAASGVRLLRHEHNQGKGAAVRTGLAEVTGDITLIQDADLEYYPADIPSLVMPIMAGNTEVVYGSRVLGPHRHRYLAYYLGGRMLTGVTNLLYGTHLTDVTTGHKAFQTSVLRNIGWKSAGFEFCAEVTARLALNRVRIVEVPIRYSPRSFAEGKKIALRDGLRALLLLIRLRIAARTPIRGRPLA